MATLQSSQQNNNNPTETDEVYRPLLPKLRVGSQSACSMLANLLDEELGKTKKQLMLKFYSKTLGSRQ